MIPITFTGLDRDFLRERLAIGFALYSSVNSFYAYYVKYYSLTYY